MKHLLHLVTADVRRFRLLLALWLIVLVMDTAFVAVRPALATDLKLATMVELIATVLFFTRWLGVIVIVPLVVQLHPLVGSDAFWMTRPIPWRTLCASKIVLLGAIFVASPALCNGALMVICRVPAARIVLVAIQTFAFHALFLSIVMGLSTVTRNLARFALAAGSILMAFVLLINVLLAYMIRNISDGPQLTVLTGRKFTDATTGVVMLMLLIAAAVVQIVVQYRTRSPRTSVAMGATSVAIAVTIAVIWPSHDRLRPVPEWAGEESSLRLTAESPKGEFPPLQDGPFSSRSDEWRIGSARLRLSGVAAGWLPTVQLADGSVQFDDGVTLTTAGNGYLSSVLFDSDDDAPARVATRQVLRVARLWDASSVFPRTEAVPIIVLPEVDFKKYSGATGKYRGRFLVGLDRLEIAAALPLSPGAEFEDRWHRIVIDQVILHSAAAVVRMRQFTTATIFDADAPPRVSFYLRNRDTAEAVAGSAHGGFAISHGLAFPAFFTGSFSAGPGIGFGVAGDFQRFPEPFGAEEPTIEINADWLSNAELVIVHTVSAGSVMRTVDIPRFEIGTGPTTLPR